VRKDGPNDFTLLVASATPQAHATYDLELQSGKVKLTVEYGDFAQPLRKTVTALKDVSTIYIDHGFQPARFNLFLNLGEEICRE
jgi:hypothetical protein